MASKTRLTAEDLWLMPEEERGDLVNGEVVREPYTGWRHGRLMLRLGSALLEYVKRHGAGDVAVGDVAFVLDLPHDRERVRGADIAFISAQRLQKGMPPEKFFHGAPDLAVEILSPSQTFASVEQKVLDYLEAGSRLVWVINPASRSATVYRAGGIGRLLCEHEQLQGEDLLPGFSILLSEIFD
jgi:Uma2 family endonuclease